MSHVSRRNFIKGAGALGAFLILPAWCAGKGLGPNDRLNVAVVGVGGRGRASVDAIASLKNARLVALCDVDDTSAADTFKHYPDVPRFKDFRVMLDKMDKDIDAVVVATPDHMHYPISVWAMSRKKHVYCEKPLARTVWETREMRRIANKYGVITQMGNQGHTKEGWRVLKEWIDADVLGEIEDVYSWTDRPNLWPQGDLPTPASAPVPATLDYKLWLGVAPHIDYFPKMLPFNWRGLKPFGTGASGDMACHVLDAAYSSMGLSAPVKIESTATKSTDLFWPATTTNHQTHKCAKGVNGIINVHWYDGAPELNKPKQVKRVAKKDLEDKRLSNGTYVVGTKETVFLDCYGGNAILQPVSRMKEFMKDGLLPKKTIPRSKHPDGPQAEFVDACIAGQKAPANFDYAAPLAEIALLNMCAVQAGIPLEYDAKKMAFTNAPEMNKYLRSLYPYNREFIAE